MLWLVWWKEILINQSYFGILFIISLTLYFQQCTLLSNSCSGPYVQRLGEQDWTTLTIPLGWALCSKTTNLCSVRAIHHCWFTLFPCTVDILDVCCIQVKGDKMWICNLKLSRFDSWCYLWIVNFVAYQPLSNISWHALILCWYVELGQK